MAAKGTLAKQLLINNIIAALPDEYVGTADNKYYFSLPENGGKVQVCISMTCPKVELDPNTGSKKAKDEGVNFADFAEAPIKPIGPTKTEAVQPQDEERENVKKLLSALGF